MVSANKIIQLTNLPARKFSAFKRRAKELKMAPEEYLQQLIEDDLETDEQFKTMSFRELVEPFRKALQGLSDAELDALVDRARRSHGKSKRGSR